MNTRALPVLLASVALIVPATCNAASLTVTAPANGVRLASEVKDAEDNALDPVRARVQIEGIADGIYDVGLRVSDSPEVSDSGRLLTSYCTAQVDYLSGGIEAVDGSWGCYAPVFGDPDYMQLEGLDLYDQRVVSTLVTFTVPLGLMRPFPVGYASATFERGISRARHPIDVADDTGTRCKRIRKIKTAFRCTSEYFLGDVLFSHSGNVMYHVADGVVAKKTVTLKTTTKNEYCIATGGHNCTRTARQRYIETAGASRYTFKVRRLR